MKDRPSKFRFFDPTKPIQTIIPIVLCVAIVAGIVYFANIINTFSITDPIYRYDTGARLDYTGRTAFERDEETGEVALKNGGRTGTLGSMPIYFVDNENKILLPEQMAVVFPDVRKHGRSGYNMVVEKDENGSYIATVRGDAVDITNSFLYDGNNTYVFLEPMTISIGLEEIDVPAYSCAYVYYNLRVEIISPDSSVNIIKQTGEVIVLATAKDLSYEIDMSKDILRTSEGEILLITDPSVLNYVTSETGKN